MITNVKNIISKNVGWIFIWNNRIKKKVKSAKGKLTKTFIVTQDISSSEEIFLKYKVGEING